MTTTIWFIILFIYGLPLFSLRYEWRATIYRDSSWLINIRPWFFKDLHALFTNKYFKDSEIVMANKFRIYLLGYVVLFVLFFLF